MTNNIMSSSTNQDNNQRLITSTDDSHLTVMMTSTQVVKMLTSPQIVLRTTITQMIILHQLTFSTWIRDEGDKPINKNSIIVKQQPKQLFTGCVNKWKESSLWTPLYLHCSLSSQTKPKQCFFLNLSDIT